MVMPPERVSTGYKINFLAKPRDTFFANAMILMLMRTAISACCDVALPGEETQCSGIKGNDTKQYKAMIIPDKLFRQWLRSLMASGGLAEFARIVFIWDLRMFISLAQRTTSVLQGQDFFSTTQY
jgi:hypothetical protein